MAIINGLYIHVKDEEMTREVETTSHPVESGIPVTDTVKAKALTISLSGKIVDYGSTKATQVIAKLTKWHETGYLIEYRGRNVASSMQIASFDSSYPNTNSGGADFTMELRQARFAKSAYVPKKTSTKAQTTAAKANPTIKVGSIVVFKGGSVYVSSDAKKAAATRSRSTCKVTHINTRSWAIHQYCLVSTDGKLVCGWVDKKNIEGTAATSTTGKTNAGTQQVKTTKQRTAVYHTVKKGDTLWTLVNKTYKSLNTTVSTVMKNNPKAFSKKNNAATLIVGKKLLMGYKTTIVKSTKATAARAQITKK